VQQLLFEPPHSSHKQPQDGICFLHLKGAAAAPTAAAVDATTDSTVDGTAGAAAYAAVAALAIDAADAVATAVVTSTSAVVFAGGGGRCWQGQGRTRHAR
jgi:hypothetical protein